MSKKVFVSGCFDLIHSGHIKFLDTAAQSGELYVSVGSDEAIQKLKNAKPLYNEKEREFILNNIKSVKEAFVSKGLGALNFKNDLKLISPDIFIVNDDGHSKEKRELCESLGIEYKVLKRVPEKGLPERCSTNIKAGRAKIPYRIDLAGGWLDQPYISKIHPGMVVNISIEGGNYEAFSGMATSTRKTASALWGDSLPSRGKATARLLFGAENPPGTSIITGSQDPYGICLPGLKYLYYDGEYLPESVDVIQDEETISWLESLIRLIPLGRRDSSFNIFEGARYEKDSVKKLAASAELCKKAIENRDKDMLGKSVTDSLKAQTELFPETLNTKVCFEILKYTNAVLGYKLAGAGGGGYLILITDKEIGHSIKVSRYK